MHNSLYLPIQLHNRPNVGKVRYPVFIINTTYDMIHAHVIHSRISGSNVNHDAPMLVKDSCNIPMKKTF